MYQFSWCEVIMASFKHHSYGEEPLSSGLQVFNFIIPFINKLRTNTYRSDKNH